MTNGTLTSRPVEDADIPILCGFPASLDELSFMFPNAAFPLTAEVLRNAITEREDSTVVCIDDAVAGFANFYGCATGESCSIGNVIVDPAQRGKGVARFLIGTMINIAAEKHRAKRVKLVCFNSNVGGLLLYTKLGFKPYAIEGRVDPQGARVAIIRMALSIDGKTADPGFAEGKSGN
ncbi:MAG: GNAT family N-acetyltransferase [Alphaproteobacteria bacterium]|nr:GNAT family N-acetyltransferase [Alphaproteobacteria bacterium]